MSSLQRYRKPGGFVQLVSLIETFGPQKRDKFIEMIEGESLAWAAALRDKMLTLERVLGWSDDVCGLILKSLPLKSQAYFLEGIEPAAKARLLQTMSGSERRRLDDILSENNPKPEEVASVLIKFVEVSRRMVQERELSLEKIAPALVIAGDFEAKLDEGATPAGNASGAPTDVVAVQRQLALALKDNKNLKDEVKALRDRLDQIRRIA